MREITFGTRDECLVCGKVKTEDNYLVVVLHLLLIHEIHNKTTNQRVIRIESKTPFDQPRYLQEMLGTK